MASVERISRPRLWPGFAKNTQVCFGCGRAGRSAILMYAQDREALRQGIIARFFQTKCVPLPAKRVQTPDCGHEASNMAQGIRHAAPHLDAQILGSYARINPQFLERLQHILGGKLCLNRRMRNDIGIA